MRQLIDAVEGDAMCTIDTLAVGTHHITAQYSVDDMSSTTPVTFDLEVAPADDRIFADGFDGNPP